MTNTMTTNTMTTNTDPTILHASRNVGMDSSASVVRRLALARDLDETVAIALPETVAAVDDFLSPILQSGEIPTVGQSLDLFRRKLAWAGENLLATDHAYLAGSARTAFLLARRDSLTQILSKKVVSLYRVCRGWLSPGDLRLLGFTSETARWPKPVLKQSREVATGLERLDVEIKSAEWPRMKIWLQEQARSLRPENRCHCNLPKQECGPENTLKTELESILRDQRLSHLKTKLWQAIEECRVEIKWINPQCRRRPVGDLGPTPGTLRRRYNAVVVALAFTFCVVARLRVDSPY